MRPKRHLSEHDLIEACYAVKGGSEGYWVHIDLIHRDDRRQNIAMTKVWSWETALALCNAVTRILHEY